MLGELLNNSASWWYESKLFVEHATAISHDTLHVVAGVLIQLAAALLLRTSVSSWGPWSAVVGFALANEAVDLWVERWPSLGMQFGESAKDVLLTVLLPTFLLLLLRWRPDVFRPRPN